jgi:hypothetical protein
MFSIYAFEYQPGTDNAVRFPFSQFTENIHLTESRAVHNLDIEQQGSLDVIEQRHGS